MPARNPYGKLYPSEVGHYWRTLVNSIREGGATGPEAFAMANRAVRERGIQVLTAFV